MSDLGRRLKEAMDAAVADAQPSPGLMDRVRRRHRHRSWMRPALAAAGLAVIAVAATTVLPGVLRGQRSVARAPGVGARFLGMLNQPGTRFIVLNATTGATVATIASPGRSTTFEDAATGNGVTYAVAVGRVGGCGARLYRFTLNSSGKPGKLSPLATGSVNARIDEMALSPDGTTLAYFAHPCGKFSAELDLTNLVTMQSRHWSDPNNGDVGSLSLTSDSRSLAYAYYTPTGGPGISFGPAIPPTLYLLRTSAVPGSLRARSVLLATGAKFGRGSTIRWAQIAPDGRTAYVATSSGPPRVDQISAIRIGTGQITALLRGLSDAFTYAADPAVTRLIAGYESAGPQHRPMAAMINLRTRHIKILPRSWPVPLYESYFW